MNSSVCNRPLPWHQVSSWIGWCSWCLLLCGNALPAQEPLRWKFTPGTKWKVQVEQETAWHTTVAGKSSPIRVESQMELTWNIDSVENNGSAKISQQFNRFRLSRQSAKVADLTYDSAAPKATGDAKIFAEALAPLLATTVPLTISPLGEIQTQALPAELVASLAKSPALQALAQTDGFNALYRQAQPALPEQAVKLGDTWEQKHEVGSSFGKIEQITQFECLASEQNEAGGTRIRSKSTFTPPKAQDESQPVIKSQEQTGLILFDATAGRLRSSETLQILTTQSSRKGVAVEVRLENKVKLSISSL